MVKIQVAVFWVMTPYNAVVGYQVFVLEDEGSVNI
jgi:hypothetical protein